MEQVGQFRILGKIGAGGMGEVYRARDERLQRDVAIKVVPASQFADAMARARLMREARSAASLNHPNICVIHEVGESDGQAFIAMECVEGESLAARITRSPLSTSEVIRFGIQLADALAHAHDKGIVHRDLKPQNIIVTPEQRLKVLDFGLAKRLEDSSDPGASTDVLVTAHGVIQGTPAYMSPEQLRGFPADARSDIWAMGVILHEMTSRKRPFEGNTWPELSAAILTSRPQELSGDVPIELSMIIRRCLEKEPANRYQKAIEIRSALEVLQTGGVSSRAIVRPAPRKPWALIAAIIAIVAIVAAGAVYFARSGSRESTVPATVAKTTPPVAAAPLVNHAVAVLPFSSFSGGEEEYLADGIQDAVIGELARMKGLRVISRTSMLRFKRANKSATDIAKTLNVDNLVEGSVARAGDRIRVQVKLIRTDPQEEQVWADAYDRDLRDVLSLYGEIATAVTGQIDSRLAAAAAKAKQPARRVDPEIYKLYLRGMYQVHKGGEEGFKQAIALMRQAIEQDPSEALGYAGLAQAYAIRVHDGLATPDDIVLGKAAAQKASSMGQELAEVYGAVAMLHQYGDRDWVLTRQNFERALALNSSLAEIRRQYSWHLLVFLKGDEALAEMRQARDTEPTEGVYYSDIGWQLQILGKYDEALVEARRGYELSPENPNNPYVLGLVYLNKGMFDEAIEAHRNLAKLVGDDTELAYSLVVAGRDKEAQPLIDKLRARRGGGAAFTLAEIYAAKGDKDEAFRWLERARPFVYAPWFGVFAELAPLRGDPRMTKFLESLKVPDVAPGWGQPRS